MRAGAARLVLRLQTAPGHRARFSGPRDVEAIDQIALLPHPEPPRSSHDLCPSTIEDRPNEVGKGSLRAAPCWPIDCGGRCMSTPGSSSACHVSARACSSVRGTLLSGTGWPLAVTCRPSGGNTVRRIFTCRAFPRAAGWADKNWTSVTADLARGRVRHPVDQDHQQPSDLPIGDRGPPTTVWDRLQHCGICSRTAATTTSLATARNLAATAWELLAPFRGARGLAAATVW